MDLDLIFREMESSVDTIYLLSSDLRITRTNRGWRTFAQENGGAAMLRSWGVGSSLVDALPEVMRDFYVQGFAAALRTGRVWEHEYECSSPTRFRRFRMFAFPATPDAILVQHARLVDAPHAGAALDPIAAEYEDAFGLVSMCANCRRVRNRRHAARWDWVPAWVARPPPHTSHGICDPCVEFHYA